LVKTAIFGQDANWGRIVCALGYSGVAFDPARARVELCGLEVFRQRQPVEADRQALESALKERDIAIEIFLGEGGAEYELLASDLTHDYVTLNSAYHN
jgi:glutamate N-acetyltransferase/amino-acid N-acetyltransferase